MGVADLAERRALAGRLRLHAAVAGLGSNLVGAIVVFTYLFLLNPRTSQFATHGQEVVTGFVVYLALVMITANIGFTRWGRPLITAFRNGEPICGRAREILFANPWRSAQVSLLGWTGAAVIFAIADLTRLDDTLLGGVRLGLSVELGGLTTMALAYLLTERAFRPAFAIAFVDEPPAESHGLDVWPRLVLSWGLGAVMPMLGIALAFAGRGVRNFTAIRSLVLALVVVGLWAGGTITRRTARAVAEPLRDLRGAMARVRAGDLDAQVTVDDASEIGLLQQGFNEMVAGLREREQLADLFGRHVGVDVARQALEHGVQLGGEVREVSALFVDVVGSTRLAATRSASDVVDALNAFFATVVRVTGAEGGWVNKFEGDAALCVFGAPLSEEDHATHALRAARRLRDELVALTAREGGLDVGIGVGCGPAVAGNIGAEDRYEYTVIGDPVNEAARLTDLAKDVDARVLASGRAVAAAADDERRWWTRRDEIVLRGRTEPTVIYEPIALPG